MTRIDDLITQLETGGAETVAFFRRLTPEQLARQVYADGAEWTARQVLAHLVTIEQSMHHLFRNILSGGVGDTGEFDLERYNRSQPRKLDDLSLEEVITRFETIRAQTVELVRGLTEADLDRKGKHPFRGEGILEEFIRWADEHARLHLEDMG